MKRYPVAISILLALVVSGWKVYAQPVCPKPAAFQSRFVGQGGAPVRIVRVEENSWGNGGTANQFREALVKAMNKWNECQQPADCDNQPTFINSFQHSDNIFNNGSEEFLAVEFVDEMPTVNNENEICLAKATRSNAVNTIKVFRRCPPGNWPVDCFPPNGPLRRFRWNTDEGVSVLIHEIGHALGLTHDCKDQPGCSNGGLMQAEYTAEESFDSDYCDYANYANCDIRQNPNKCVFPGGAFMVSGEVSGLAANTSGHINLITRINGTLLPSRQGSTSGPNHRWDFANVPHGASVTPHFVEDGEARHDCMPPTVPVNGDVSGVVVSCTPGPVDPDQDDDEYDGPFANFLPPNQPEGLCLLALRFCNSSLIPWYWLFDDDNAPAGCRTQCEEVTVYELDVPASSCTTSLSCGPVCGAQATTSEQATSTIEGPTLWLAEPALNSIVSNQLPVSGWAEAGSGIRDFLFYLDHEEVELDQLVIEPSGNGLSYSGKLDTSGLSAGEYFLQVITVDGQEQSVAAMFERRFEVTAVPGEPDIEVRLDWNGASIPDGSSYTFGESPAPGGFVNRKFRVRNRGDEVLTISNPMDLVSGDCFAQGGSPGHAVGPGATKYFHVKLSCPTAGSYQGQVTIHSNDPDDENPYTFTVSGTVVEGGTGGDPPPPPSSPGACSGLVQEAEHGSLTGFEVVSDGNASGSQYIRVPAGVGDATTPSSAYRASYCFSVPASGVYRLKSRVRAPLFEDDSFFVQIDGAPAGGYLWSTQVGPGFEQDYLNDWGVEDPVEFFLGAGDHALDIYLREDGAGLDRLELELSDSAPPCGGLVQEAEAGVLTGFSVVDDAGSSGGQAIVVPNGTGDNMAPQEGFKASYCFMVPTAGTYRIVGREKAPSFADDSFWVRVDAEPNQLEAYLWSMRVGTIYQEDYVNDVNVEDPVEVFLSAGMHTVDVYQREDGAYLDTIALEEQVVEPCGPLVQEAESGELTGFSIITDAAASGGQAIEVPNGPGDWGEPHPDLRARYCFWVQTPGNYRIAARTLAPSHGDDSFWARVDGSPASGYLWNLTVGQEYQAEYVGDFNGDDPVEVFFNTGNHVVEIYMREDGSRLDRIELERQ